MDILKFDSLFEPFKIYNLNGYSNSFVKEFLKKNNAVHVLQYSNYDEELSKLLKIDGDFLFRIPVCPITENNIKSVILITPLGKYFDYESIKHRINNNVFECPITRIKYNYRDLFTVKINTIKELLFYFELIHTYNRNEHGTFKQYMKSKIIKVSVETMAELERLITTDIKSPLKIKCTKNFDYIEGTIVQIVKNMHILSLKIYFNKSSEVFFKNELKELKSLCLSGPGDIHMDKINSFILPNNLVKLKLIASESIREFSMIEFGRRVILSNCLKEIVLINNFCVAIPKVFSNTLFEYEDFEKYSTLLTNNSSGLFVIDNINNFLKRKNNKLRYLSINCFCVNRLLFYRLIENVKHYLEYLEIENWDLGPEVLLSETDFPVLPFLKTLNINQLVEIKISFFQRFPNLEELILKQVTIAKDVDFDFLHNLKVLKIDDRVIMPHP